VRVGATGGRGATAPAGAEAWRRSSGLKYLWRLLVAHGHAP
jgi:hypothetical protein